MLFKDENARWMPAPPPDAPICGLRCPFVGDALDRNGSNPTFERLLLTKKRASFTRTLSIDLTSSALSIDRVRPPKFHMVVEKYKCGSGRNVLYIIKNNFWTAARETLCV